ncbi:MAG TPA: hypothetical protein VKZ54_11300 [Membranihabitans sp.]|nr:hypothetical protein [Membranihabitans sp.]
MNQTEFRTYQKLKVKRALTQNAIPKSVLNSTQFNGLISSGILKKEKSGRGFRIYVERFDEFDRFFHTYFPEPGDVMNKADNVRMFRNSKISQTQTLPVFLLRGFQGVEVDGNPVDLEYFTRQFNMFACAGKDIATDKLCLVENLDTFLVAEKLLGEAYVFVHKYGRVGKASLEMFDPQEVCVFVDYDFNGLDEYLRIKEVFVFAELFVPADFEVLFSRFSKSLSGNRASMSNRVRNSDLSEVVRIRDMVVRTNRFLEQQYWKYD